MRTIEVSDDVYKKLLSSAEQIGEDADSILRRILNGEVRSGNSDIILSVITSSGYKSMSTVTARFLYLLSKLYFADTGSFEAVAEVSGRSRVYFSKFKKEIEVTGNSTDPQRIPDSPWYVVTNTSNDMKRHIMTRVLNILGFSKEDTNLAVKSLFK